MKTSANHTGHAHGRRARRSMLGAGAGYRLVAAAIAAIALWLAVWWALG